MSLTYCPGCNYLLDISKPPASKKGGAEGVVDEVQKLFSLLSKGKALELETYPIETIQILAAHPKFKKLTPAFKKKIQARLDENMAKEGNEVFYVCSNCGFHKPLKPGTMLYRKNLGSIETSLETNPYILHSTTLPLTRDYLCPQEACPTHKDPTKKMAVMERIGETYQMTYFCTACKHKWLSE